MRVLVTGGAGFIGSALVRGCLEAGYRVRVLDDFSTGRRENLQEVRGDVELVEGCVADPKVARRAIRDCEVVYHHAAQTSVARSVEDPVGSHAVNATGTLILLQASLEAGVRRVVFASSLAVYGDGGELPKVEEMPPRPESPYALQKWIGEQYCAQYSKLHGLETVALRYSNVFGPRQDPGSAYAAVVPGFATAIASGSRARVYGDGHQTRDFVFVSDVVAANLAAADSTDAGAGEVFNVSRGERTSVLDLLERISALLGRNGLEPIFEPARAGDVRHSQADPSRAARLLGWRPRVELEAGLREVLDFYVPKAEPS